MTPINYIHRLTAINESSIAAVIALLEDGATIPFIARYRKEKTGSLDEVQIAEIKIAYEDFQKLIKRKESILSAIEEQGKLSPSLKQEIEKCWDSTTLEDIYLPFKKSKKTKADTAREHGLEPLAKIIMSQRSNQLEHEAKRFLIKPINTTAEALEGARHIIAEWINENTDLRATVRSLFAKHAILSASVITKKKDEAENYKDYFDFAAPLHKSPSHRVLAIYRGTDEGLLKMKISIDEDRLVDRYERYYIKSRGDAASQISMAIRDALKRLVLPSIETEFKNAAKEKADKEAIEVFANNLRQLLLSSPLGQMPVLALDPGFRTGCKLVVLDEHGNLLHHTTIYPHPPQSATEQSLHTITRLLKKYAIGHIAIGNGTAGRETYQLLADNQINAELYMVNENGASIYSASPVAREEFPALDITVRGAISIGRRLMDPLAELVKIDPKSIGVGQYQHDVNQSLLKIASIVSSNPALMP